MTYTNALEIGMAETREFITQLESIRDQIIVAQSDGRHSDVESLIAQVRPIQDKLDNAMRFVDVALMEGEFSL